jgi:hypothetical protein
VIVTLTANPSLDRTIEVVALQRGAVIRALSGRIDAGGKGVNVSRALARHGHKSMAVVPTGGPDGAQMQALLDGAAAESGLDIRPVPIAGSVRSNVTVVEADGTTTKLNEAGPRLTEAELEALAAATAEASAGADWAQRPRWRNWRPSSKPTTTRHDRRALRHRRQRRGGGGCGGPPGHSARPPRFRPGGDLDR